MSILDLPKEHINETWINGRGYTKIFWGTPDNFSNSDNSWTRRRHAGWEKKSEAWEKIIPIPEYNRHKYGKNLSVVYFPETFEKYVYAGGIYQYPKSVVLIDFCDDGFYDPEVKSVENTSDLINIELELISKISEK